MNGENVAKEEELVDSQGPDRTEESGTGSYLTNPDGDYPFPILLTTEDNPLAKVAEDLCVNENELDSKALMDIFNKVTKLLDSMDMSLDLIYGAVSGGDAPIAATRFRQQRIGRHTTPPKIKAATEG